jgi:hypothetical protein
MSGLEENYRRLLDRIGTAAARSGRDRAQVRLVGATKRVEAARIRRAIELGLNDIGENRVQEAEGKLAALAPTGVRCHLIGHLQSNKARRALDLFTSIQSVDSFELAGRLDRMLDRRFPVFIQIRSAEESTRSGVPESDLPQLVQAVRDSRWLDLDGFMAIPPFFEDPEDGRLCFRRLRELRDAHDVRELSMGMSHDFEVAIEEGATQVRIGTALFGERT